MRRIGDREAKFRRELGDWGPGNEGFGGEGGSRVGIGRWAKWDHEKRARVGSKPRESAHVEAVVLPTVTCSVFQADPLGRHVLPAPDACGQTPSVGDVCFPILIV
ncbi:hypothetical protein BHM03_00050057 [Ensete ventricosum]|nr:hypothetical protein BHM03_00050057 [Ensete ventricosum]